MRNCLVNSSLLKSKSFKICLSLICEYSFENLSKISLLCQDLFLLPRTQAMKNSSKHGCPTCKIMPEWPQPFAVMPEPEGSEGGGHCTAPLRPQNSADQLKFIYSEKATTFCEISTVDLTVTT